MNIQANRHEGQRASPPVWPLLSGGSQNPRVWVGRDPKAHPFQPLTPSSAGVCLQLLLLAKTEVWGPCTPTCTRCPQALPRALGMQVYKTFSTVRAVHPDPKSPPTPAAQTPICIANGRRGIPNDSGWKLELKSWPLPVTKCTYSLQIKESDYFLLLKMLFYSKVLNIGSFSIGITFKKSFKKGWELSFLFQLETNVSSV